MCRNIKTLFNFDPPVTGDEVRAASLQYVRKISGFTKPSHANEAAIEQAMSYLNAKVTASPTGWRAAFTSYVAGSGTLFSRRYTPSWAR